jgi:hypothetical protein
MPLLNGSSRSSVTLRVPSGNTISASPPSSAVAICLIGSSLRVSVLRSISTARKKWLMT